LSNQALGCTVKPVYIYLLFSHSLLSTLSLLTHYSLTTFYTLLSTPQTVLFISLRCSEVLVVPTDDPLPEELAWKYYRDVVHGLEYRK